MAKKKPAKKKTVKTARKAAPKKKASAKRKPAAKAAPKKKGSAKARKRVAAPEQHALPWREPLPGEAKAGVVDDYFGHLGVIAFKLEGTLNVGDKIHVRGHTTDLAQTVESMQLNHQAVTQAQAGDAVGVKVNDKCRKGDYVYRAAP